MENTDFNTKGQVAVDSSVPWITTLISGTPYVTGRTMAYVSGLSRSEHYCPLDLYTYIKDHSYEVAMILNKMCWDLKLGTEMSLDQYQKVLQLSSRGHLDKAVFAVALSTPEVDIGTSKATGVARIEEYLVELLMNRVGEAMVLNKIGGKEE